MGLLCSNAIYGSTFNEKLKKELLKSFNDSPGNIKGQKLRFIIFDSGFKEGIDLFDFKLSSYFITKNNSLIDTNNRSCNKNMWSKRIGFSTLSRLAFICI